MELQLNKHLQRAIDGLTENFSDKIINVYQLSGDTFVHIEPDANVAVCQYLRDEEHFISLIDVFGSDRFTTEDRFEVIYNLISLRNQQRLFVKAWLPEEEPTIASVTSLWEAANWFEREVYDMFGIWFTNHPDLRRIYMPEDYNYFPLRKEFPLLGIPGSIDLPSTTPDTE